MSQNLWQIVNRDDLLYFLRGGKGKFIVLTMVLLSTDDNTKKIIKKFIKNKSKQYPHITFLYYVVRNEDFSKKISFLNNNVNEYPKMCHIYNVDTMLIELKAIDGIDIMEKSFKKLDEYYSANGKQNHNQQKTDELEESEESESSQGDKQLPVHQITPQIANSIGGMLPSDATQQNTQYPTQQINPVLERKKLLEKLTLLRNKSEEYTIEFLKECQKRKKEEEKQKTKNKK